MFCKYHITTKFQDSFEKLFSLTSPEQKLLITNCTNKNKSKIWIYETIPEHYNHIQHMKKLVLL